jgi:hypothetical protein
MPNPYQLSLPGTEPGMSIMIQWYPERNEAVCTVTFALAQIGEGCDRDVAEVSLVGPGRVRFVMSGDEFDRLRRVTHHWPRFR